jgi:cation diffusion facilitator CzcD-associated flavoprotein CzcO
MTNPSIATRKRIAIIGAGAAGLAQAKQVLDAFRTSDNGVELVVFESRNDVGGVW